METYRTYIVMWTILGLVFLSASAHLVTLQAIVGEKVLLHFPCEKRNEREDIKWQLEDHTILLHHFGRHNTTTIREGYENRVSLFLNEDRDNCSLLLSGITVADNGMYKCYFYIGKTFNYIHFTLNVAANYSVCMHQVSDQASVDSRVGEGFGVYQCIASGGYPKGQIHWEMDGRPLVNTSMRDETYQDNSTGLYSLTSNLTMELSQGEKLQCMVENRDQAKLASSCTETPVPSIKTPLESFDKVAVAAGVPVSVVVGVLLVIFLLTRCHRGERSTKQRDTGEGNVTQSLNMYEDSV